MTNPTYDVMIIGSGAAGGMAAYSLTRQGIKCLVLDAGPPVDLQRQLARRPVHELPYRGLGKPGRSGAHFFENNEFLENAWLDEKRVPYIHDPKEPYIWVRVRAVGGKTLIWGRMSYRLSDYEFKAKNHDGFGDNWPISYSDLEPYYDKVEPIFRVSGRREGLAQLPDGIFVEDKSPDSDAVKRFAAAGKGRGITVTKFRRALGRDQLASSLNLLLPAAQATGNLTIIPDAVVRDITVDKNTGLAAGVNFVDRRTGRELYAKARVVVVGASCLESTRLLLNSGIANSSGVLGRYLHDHFYMQPGVVGVIPEARDGKSSGALVGGAGYVPRFINLKERKANYLRGYACDFIPGISLEAKYFPGWGEELQRELDRSSEAGFHVHIMGEVLPRFENHVRIDAKVVDAWGIPVLNIRARYSDNENNMAKDALETMSQVCLEAGFEILTRIDRAFPPGYSIHEMGTCRMGDDRKTSVLNKWNQSHDIKNLFVVDGSSFVSGGSQNPTLTIMALAMRSADYLADQMRKGNL